MRVRLYCAVAVIAIASGCAGRTDVPIVEAEVQRCPAAPPVGTCPPFPDVGHTPSVEQLEDAWIDAGVVHAKCATLVESWHKDWSECSDE